MWDIGLDESSSLQDALIREGYTVYVTCPYLTSSTGPPVVTSVTVLPAPTLLPGADFSIHCTVSAPPAASVSINWYRDGTLLVPTGDPRIQIDTESGTLTVYNADESYSAVYTCNASTSYAFDTSQVTVTIGCELTALSTLSLLNCFQIAV